MKTMRLLTAGLKTVQLDWALAKATGREVCLGHCNGVLVQLDCGGWFSFEGHTDPAVCTSLIKEHKLSIAHGCDGNTEVFAQPSTITSPMWPRGANLEEAVARCVCLMHFGEWVDMPIELCSMDVL